MAIYPDSSQRGAVSRVASVERLGAASAATRVLDVQPGAVPWLRPAPAQIAPADVARFQALVYGPAGRLGLVPGAPDLQTLPTGPVTPADRIVQTLRQLRQVEQL